MKNATTSDDAERSKPDPDILVAALKKSGSSPDQAVMIGDTPYDIETASRAGLATIAFRCGGWDDPGLHGAIAITMTRDSCWIACANRRSMSRHLNYFGEMRTVTEDMGLQPEKHRSGEVASGGLAAVWTSRRS